MSIYKRGETWYIQFTDQHGCRIQQSANTKNRQEALELHDKLKAESWRIKHVGDRKRYTYKEAVVRWITEQQHRKRPEDDAQQIRFLDAHLKDKYLDEINKTLIDRIKTEKLKTGVKNSTVNRMLNFIRALLNKARNEWEWLDSVPKVKKLTESNKRIRWLTGPETALLLKELPDHLRLMCEFTLATGLRESNVTGLQWSQIDMQRNTAWIHPDQAKSGKAIAVPLNDDAVRIIRSQVGKHLTHVFTYKGEPVCRANNHAWRKALIRAGITDFRWHDLRHTWASNHIQNGTPLHILKELGGWADLSMVMRYAHLSSEHLAEYAGNVKGVFQVNVTDLLHSQKQA